MATVYRRAPALQCDFYRTDVLSSDWESLCRLAVLGKVGYLDMVAGVWDIGPDSASRTRDWRQLRNNLDIWIPVEAALRRSGIPGETAAPAIRAIVGTFSSQYFRIILQGGGLSDPLRFWWSLRTLSRTAMARIAFSWRAWILYAGRLARSIRISLPPAWKSSRRSRS
jgi:hypothetical protein